MDISFWLEKFSFNPKALLDYGFVQNGSCYLLHKELETTGMTAVFCLSQSAFTVSVFDSDTNENTHPLNCPTAPVILWELCVEKQRRLQMTLQSVALRAKVCVGRC